MTIAARTAPSTAPRDRVLALCLALLLGAALPAPADGQVLGGGEGGG
jgi:hypothetical protein